MTTRIASARHRGWAMGRRQGGAWVRELLAALLAVTTLGCAGTRAAHRLPATTAPAATPSKATPSTPEASVIPRLLVIALDAVPHDVIAALVQAGEFEQFHPPAPLVSTFPSATSLAMSGILEPFGVARSEGYEARYYDRARNKIRGGGFFSYNRLKAPWRTAWDWKAGNVRKLTSGLLPVRASLRAIDDILASFTASDDPVYLAYTDATDLAGHLKGPDSLDRILTHLSEGLERLHQTQPERPFITVLFSDHGQAGGKPLLNVRRALKRALRAGGFRSRGRLKQDQDVVLVPFGLLSSIIAYTRPAAADAVAAALAKAEGVDLCVSVVDGDAWRVVNAEGLARIERRRDEDAPAWRYRVEDGSDPLGLVDLAGTDPDLWQDDAWWQVQTRGHRYPDPFHRIARGFDLVQNPASVICSLETRAMYGAVLTSVSSRLSVGHLEWTHGALHHDASFGFVMSDLPGWQPDGAQRFDRALVPFAAFARTRHGVDPVVEPRDPSPQRDR